jgi:hypothetical protein
MLALKTSTDALAIFLNALAATDLDKIPPLPGSFQQFGVTLADVDTDARRVLLVNWILGKGFHDLTRAVRQSLEEAFFYIRIFHSQPESMTYGELMERLKVFAREANAMNFPDLMRAVSDGLVSPLSFAAEFVSLQKARNCLEHRAGRVGAKDVDADGELKLSLPIWYMFVKHGDEEIPIVGEMLIQAGDSVMIRRETMKKVFKLGEPLEISAADFTRIAQACLYFSIDLGSKLPTSPPPDAGGTPGDVVSNAL